jgi:hypothetical protein
VAETQKPNVVPNLVKINIDGQDLQVAPGTTLIEAAKKVDTFIPHFCYHPGLTIVGQCRMCYVEIEGQKKLATACSTTVAEGMRVKTNSEFVQKGQTSTLEFVLLDHPLDCPICDRGGECKLQDYTYDHGPSRSRMTEEKELLLKHQPVSANVMLDQERCILCTRCVRFSSEIDGRTELVVNERASKSKIDVFDGRPMQSPFSGNVVDLCPVGALTATDYRFKARPWELRHHLGLCTGCSMGCNVEIHTKHRHHGITRPDQMPPKPLIERLVPRENTQVNDWWMCDMGRWGYHFHNNEERRLYTPMIRRDQILESTSLREVQAAIDAAQGPWEFWVWDEAPHEEISWAKSLLSSWEKRGRKVAGFNPLKYSRKFLEIWAEKTSAPLFAAPAQWRTYKKIVSLLGSYRDLETQIPVVSAIFGPSIRKGSVQWETRNQKSFYSSDDVLSETLYLLPIPQSEGELGLYKNLPGSAHALPLLKRMNGRGLLNEGITPIEMLDTELAGQRPQGPVFVFSQSTQNPLPANFVNYLKQAPFIVVADSLRGVLTDMAQVVLPLEPLYEARFTATNFGNRRQESAGIQLHHPNYASLERGGSLVSPTLQLL